MEIRGTTTLEGAQLADERVLGRLFAQLEIHGAGLRPTVSRDGDREISVGLAIEAPTLQAALVLTDGVISAVLDDVLGVSAPDLVSHVEAERADASSG